MGDNLIVSCGNEDDSRIIIWDIGSREIVHELKTSEKTAFYYLNLIVLDNVPYQLVLTLIGTGTF